MIRYERSLRRKVENDVPSTSTGINHLEEMQINEVTSTPSQHFSCQANLGSDQQDFIFECSFSHGGVISTQVNIPTDVNFKATSEKCVGNNDSIDCEGFHGFATIKDDFQIVPVELIS